MSDTDSIYGFKNLPKPGLPPLPPPEEQREMLRQAEAMDAEFGQPLGDAPGIGQRPQLGTPVPEGRKFEELFPDQPRPVVIQGWEDMMQTLRDIRNDVETIKNNIWALARR